MKNKFGLLLVLMFGGMLSIHAQQGFQRRTVEERVKSTMDKISDPLKLTATQQGDVANTFTGYYNAMQKLREGMAQGSRPDKADMEKITADRDAKLKVFFTEQQYNKFKDELEPTMRRSRGDRPQGNN